MTSRLARIVTVGVATAALLKTVNEGTTTRAIMIRMTKTGDIIIDTMTMMMASIIETAKMKSIVKGIIIKIMR